MGEVQGNRHFQISKAISTDMKAGPAGRTSRILIPCGVSGASTRCDVYAPERWVDDALVRPEVREAYRRLVAHGWTDALRALQKYFRNACNV